MTHTGRFAILAVGGSDTKPSMPDLHEATTWYDALSGGRWHPKPLFLPPVHLPHSTSFYSATCRGLSVRGPNSRDLVADVIATLDTRFKRKLAGVGGKLAIVTPDSFRAHVWYPANGGLALGGGKWCRRFAVIPQSAPLGTVVHELAHLLLHWPDGEPGVGYCCLMAMGGHCGEGKTPAAPAAPLLLAEGWRRPLNLTPQTTIAQLKFAKLAVGTSFWRGHKIIVEVRKDRLLAWTGPMYRPRLLGDCLIADREEMPALGCLAQTLRGLLPLGKSLQPNCHETEQASVDLAL